MHCNNFDRYPNQIKREYIIVHYTLYSYIYEQFFDKKKKAEAQNVIELQMKIGIFTRCMFGVERTQTQIN